MLWYWIDRYTELRRGERAVALKMVTRAERHVSDQYPESPRLPSSLVMEGMAQLAGELVSDAIGHTRMVIMAKIVKAEFFFDAEPGDCLEYTADVVRIDENGSRVRITSTRRSAASSTEPPKLHAEAQIVFAHLDHHATENTADAENADHAPQVRFGPEVLREWMERAGAVTLLRD